MMMTVYQWCPRCKTPMPCLPDGGWYTFICPCGYQGYPLRYSITYLQSGSTTNGMLSGGFAAWDTTTNAPYPYGAPRTPNPLPFAAPESELPVWATPDREPVPEAFQQAFAEGELEL